jgi:hypothetical protein
MKDMSNQFHKKETSKEKKEPPSDMYRARPFVITRYAVPNGRGQRRLQPSQEEDAAGSSHCTKSYRHGRLLIVEESKKKEGVGI